MADEILKISGSMSGNDEISVALEDITKQLNTLGYAVDKVNRTQLPQLAGRLGEVARAARAFGNIADTLDSSMSAMSKGFGADTLISYNRELYKLGLVTGQTDKTFGDFKKSLDSLSEKTGYSRQTVVAWGQSFQQSTAFVGKSLTELAPILQRVSEAFISPEEIAAGSASLQKYSATLTSTAKAGMLAGNDMTGYMQALMSGDMAGAANIQQYMQSSGGALGGTKSETRALEKKTVQKEEKGKEANLRIAEVLEPLSTGITQLNSILLELKGAFPMFGAAGRIGQAQGSIADIGNTVNSGLDLLQGTKIGKSLEGVLGGGGKGVLGKLGGIAGKLLGRGGISAAGGAAAGGQLGFAGQLFGGAGDVVENIAGKTIGKLGGAVLSKIAGPVLAKAAIGLGAKAIPFVGQAIMASDALNWIGHKTGILNKNIDISGSSWINKGLVAGMKAVGGLFGKKEEKEKNAADIKTQSKDSAVYKTMEDFSVRMQELTNSLGVASYQLEMKKLTTTGVAEALGVNTNITGREMAKAQLPELRAQLAASQKKIDEIQKLKADPKMSAANKVKFDEAQVENIKKARNEFAGINNTLTAAEIASVSFQKTWQQIRVEAMNPLKIAEVAMTTGSVSQTLALQGEQALTTMRAAEQLASSIEEKKAKVREKLIADGENELAINEALANMDTELLAARQAANNAQLKYSIDMATQLQSIGGMKAEEWTRNKALFELEQARTKILPTSLGMQMEYAKQGLNLSNQNIASLEEALAKIPQGAEMDIARWQIQKQIGEEKNKQATQYMELTGGLVGQFESALGELSMMDSDISDFMPKMAEVGQMMMGQGFGDFAPSWKYGGFGGGGEEAQNRVGLMSSNDGFGGFSNADNKAIGPAELLDAANTSNAHLEKIAREIENSSITYVR